MALSANALSDAISSQLQNFPETVEDAIDAWAQAYCDFFANAVCGPVPVSGAISGAPLTQLKAGLANLNTAGAAALQTGITAFWTIIVGSPSIYFTGALAVVAPVALSSLSATLSAVFAANTSGNVDKETSIGNIAAAIYTASLGGTGTLPGSPPTVYPII